MVNQPTGPVISETMSEKPLDSLTTLDGEELKLDGGGMYPSFKSPNLEEKESNEKVGKKETNEDELNLNESILEKNSENPVTPLLKRINNISGVHVGDEDLEKIYDNIPDVNNENDVISVLIEGLDKTGIDKKTKDILSTILIQVGKNNDDRLKEGKDQEVVLPEEFKGNKILENDKNKNIVELLAKNYISFPDNDNGDPDFEKDLQLSIETTANKIIYNKEVPQSLGLDKAKQDIKSGNLELQLEALNYIYSLVNTNEGKEGKASKLSYKKIKQKENGEKQSLQDNFDDLQKRSQIAMNEKNSEELKKIKVEVNNLKEDADKEGDIFIVSDLDKINGEIDSVLKETT